MTRQIHEEDLVGLAGTDEHMVDPTSDLGEDVTEEEAPTCATCGEPVLHESRHRVITWIDDGAVRTAHFCNDDCRTAWDGDESAVV